MERKLKLEAEQAKDSVKPDSESNKASKKSLHKSPAKEDVKFSTKEPEKVPAPSEELSLITLVGQREKLCRDDLTAMMLAGEESLKMLIKDPSDQLLDFIRANLHDEDAILSKIPRYEIPKVDFETQVLREMKVVLRESIGKFCENFAKDDLVSYQELSDFYLGLENFDYPHKDKLLEFIKYYFMEFVANKDLIMMNMASLKEHLQGKKGVMSPSSEKSRNPSHLRSGRKPSVDSQSSETKMKVMGGTITSDEDKA